MRKLLLILLATALTGSFTSCVENQIPDEVVQIYDNQADLLAAQAALLQSQSAINAAEAIRVAAQASLANAQAEYQLALAANQNAQAAATLAAAEQAAALAAFNLQKAQDQWAADMAAMQVNIRNAKNAAITTAFNNYITAKRTYDNFALTESANQLAIVNHMQKTQDDKSSDDAALANLESDVTVKEADLAVLQGMLADLEALKLPGSTVGDRIALKESYEATVEANTNTSHDLAIEIAQLLNAFNDAVAARVASGYDAVETDYAQLQADYTTARTDAENDRATVAGKEAAITAQENAIDVLQDIVDNFDTKLADFKADVTAAEAAETAADNDVTAATTAEADAAQDEADAEALIVTENANLVTVQNNAAAANASLDAAINAYEAALIAAAAADVPARQADLDAANALVVTRQGEYDTAKTIFDAAPLGSTYANGGADGVLGDHSDDGVSNETYAEITTVNPDGTGEFGVLRYTSLADVIAIPGVVSGNNYGNFVQVPDQGRYYDVEADDPAPVANADVLAAAADALDAAKAAVGPAETALANEMTLGDTSAEKAAYEAAEDFYNTAAAKVAAQEAVVAAAVAAEVIAEDAHDDAIDALADATTAQTAAQGVTVAAQNALTAFEGSTEREYQVQLEAAMVNLDVLNDDLATAQLSLTENDALALSLVAMIDAGPTYTADQMAAAAAADAALVAHDAKDDEKTALDNENLRLNAYIALIDLAEEANIDLMITAKETEITNAEADLDTAKDAVTNFVSREAANKTTLENLEAVLARTQSDMANQQLVVDTMKAILDSIL